MEKIRKILCLILIGLMISCCLTACKEEVVETTEDTTPATYDVIENMSDLQRNCMYVEVDGGYASPYWGYTSFSTDNYTSTNTSNVAWFMEEEWGMIPTVYKGGHVIYRTNSDFSETFYFQKFADLGYTVGICNMSQTSTGRYKISTDVDNNQINPASDCKKLYDLQGVNITIDRVGGQSLRSSRVSSCGTITGLEKDEEYSADIYVGTEIEKDYTLKADSRVFQNIQTNQVSNYEFVQAEIIKIEIPSYFKSGYYSVDGTGIFRYIAEGEYTEDTEMNEVNVDDNSYQGMGSDEYYYTNGYTEDITVTNNGNYIMYIEFEGDVNEDLLPEGKTAETADEPEAIFEVNGEYTEFEQVDGITLKGEYYATRGVYTLEVKNTYGRNILVSTIYQGEDSELEKYTIEEETTDETVGETTEESETMEESEESTTAESETTTITN